MNKSIKHSITIMPAGFGHYNVTVHNWHKKDKTFVTNNTSAINDWNSQDGEKDGKAVRKIRAYKFFMWMCRK